MFDVWHTDTLPATPWKNGGGLTREIARREENGALIWRISLANVDRDGPFSQFAGLMRVLTVIDGAGIDLRSPNSVIMARFGAPVRFSGELPVEGRLIGGPIRDLNVIFDPTRIRADVNAMFHPARVTLGPVLSGFFVINGPVTADDALLVQRAFVLGTTGVINLGPGASGLLIRLQNLP